MNKHVWNYSELKRELQLANYNTDGRYLSEATNFELYNFVREYKTCLLYTSGSWKRYEINEKSRNALFLL